MVLAGSNDKKKVALCRNIFRGKVTSLLFPFLEKTGKSSQVRYVVDFLSDFLIAHHHRN